MSIFYLEYILECYFEYEYKYICLLLLWIFISQRMIMQIKKMMIN